MTCGLITDHLKRTATAEILERAPSVTDAFINYKCDEIFERVGKDVATKPVEGVEAVWIGKAFLTDSMFFGL